MLPVGGGRPEDRAWCCHRLRTRAPPGVKNDCLSGMLDRAFGHRASGPDDLLTTASRAGAIGDREPIMPMRGRRGAAENPVDLLVHQWASPGVGPGAGPGVSPGAGQP